MRVSNEDWSRYIRQLSAVNRKAAEVMQSWMDEHPNADGEDLVATAYAVSEHYGDAAGSLACSMYDALAEAQGAAVPPAEPAPNATYDETAKAVYGTLKNKQNTVPATVGRLVKQTGADTMLQNAQRDRAQFAWIPMGDTCAFCLTLGSRGWQNQSKKAMKNGHAEHIHANCDCQYAVRFDGRSTVEGYDPDALKAQYDSFEGTPQEKINAWRREIAAEKRAAAEVDGAKKIGLPKNGNGGIVKNIRLPAELDSVPGMSEDTRDAISKAFDSIMNEYDVWLDSVEVESLGKEFIDVPFQYQPFNHGTFLGSKIVINSDYHFNGSLEAFNARIMRSYSSGMLASKTVEDLIAHELAHVMTFQGADNYAVFLNLENEVRELFVGGVSMYSDRTRDGAETIAEGFVRMRNGEQVPKEVQNMVRQYVERWSKNG